MKKRKLKTIEASYRTIPVAPQKKPLHKRFVRWLVVSSLKFSATAGAIAGLYFGGWSYASAFVMRHVETLNLVQEEDKEVSAVKEFARLQAELGEVKLPKIKSYSKAQLKGLVSKVAQEECQAGNGCFNPLVLAAIVDREGGWKPDAIGIEKNLIGVKVKKLEGEGALSQAIGHLSFGLAQVNWGWHKSTCADLLEESAHGDKSSMYVELLKPEINLKCALRVLKEKWDGAKGKPNRLLEAVGCYNGMVGGKCNLVYGKDVLQVRLVKMAQQETEG